MLQEILEDFLVARLGSCGQRSEAGQRIHQVEVNVGQGHHVFNQLKELSNKMKFIKIMLHEIFRLFQ
jgi:hypothetical protein